MFHQWEGVTTDRPRFLKEPAWGSRPGQGITPARNTRGSFIVISPLLHLRVQEFILGIDSHSSSLPGAAFPLLSLA